MTVSLLNLACLNCILPEHIQILCFLPAFCKKMQKVKRTTIFSKQKADTLFEGSFFCYRNQHKTQYADSRIIQNLSIWKCRKNWNSHLKIYKLPKILISWPLRTSHDFPFVCFTASLHISCAVDKNHQKCRSKKKKS